MFSIVSRDPCIQQMTGFERRWTIDSIGKYNGGVLSHQNGTGMLIYFRNVVTLRLEVVVPCLVLCVVVT